jgi:hypothetical protein
MKFLEVIGRIFVTRWSVGNFVAHLIPTRDDRPIFGCYLSKPTLTACCLIDAKNTMQNQSARH